MEDHGEQINPINKVLQLFESDQKDRQLYAQNPTQGLEIRQRDEQRLIQAKKIVANDKISDPQEFNMLAFIFQHGDSVQEYKQALSLTTKAVEAGLPPSLSLIPQATDRLMIREQLDRGVSFDKLKQKYGTQTMFNEKGEPITPVLDGSATIEEFKKFGIER